ncbi:hypothetical protein [Chitinophaga qingshengii]|uniref:Uncharacterized protein n=1 Tax=Chitinophaga qingshengii TaxID=1569794 RepID=A0ABR7TJY1_9BACT|nr:hypothetical protein [Chitinophaga qingshengii]MBC9929833.1 hypothetical protein [Chitinophaga qingshengii]
MLFPSFISTIRRRRPSFLRSAAAQRICAGVDPSGNPAPAESETVEDTDSVLDEENNLSDEEADKIEWEPEEEQEESSGNA